MIICNLELFLALHSETTMELSRITQINVDTLCKIKNNKYNSISLDNAFQLCKHYKCTLGQLYTLQTTNLDSNESMEQALVRFNQFEKEVAAPAPVWQSSDDLAFKCNLKKFMLLKKIPQYKLAEETHMQIIRIRNMQKNNISYIRFEEIESICSYFGCTLDSLYSLEKK